MLDLVSLRRDFHMHPEVGFTEFRTASKVVEILASLGFDVIYGADAMEGGSRRGLPSPDVLEAAYERALRDGANPQIVEKMRGGYTAVIGVKKESRKGLPSRSGLTWMRCLSWKVRTRTTSPGKGISLPL